MPIKKPTPRKDVHVYFSPDTHKMIKALAEKNRRSISSEVIIAVENHLIKENGGK